jgi:hypothetical protein
MHAAHSGLFGVCWGPVYPVRWRGQDGLWSGRTARLERALSLRKGPVTAWITGPLCVMRSGRQRGQKSSLSGGRQPNSQRAERPAGTNMADQRGSPEVFAGPVLPSAVSTLSELASATFRQRRRAASIDTRDPAPCGCGSITTGGRARRRATGAKRDAASEKGQGPALLGQADYGSTDRHDDGLQGRRTTYGRCPTQGSEAPLCGRQSACIADLCAGHWLRGRALGVGRW